MRYISTRQGSQGNPAPLGFEAVMLAGLARDGGLYLPAEWPHFSTAEIAAMKGLSYGELAFRIMRPFVGDAFDEATFRRLIGESLGFGLRIAIGRRFSLHRQPRPSFRDHLCRHHSRNFGIPAGSAAIFRLFADYDGKRFGDFRLGVSNLLEVLL